MNIAFNITGTQFDEYHRQAGRQIFISLIHNLMYVNETARGEDAAYFRYCYAVISAMLGQNHCIPGAQRTYNDRRGYGAGHADAFGVYHFLNVRLILSTSSVLCIDNYIISRPRDC